jgi:hypothetical protein
VRIFRAGPSRETFVGVLRSFFGFSSRSTVSMVNLRHLHCFLAFAKSGLPFPYKILFPHGMLMLLLCPNPLTFVSMSTRPHPNLQKYALESAYGGEPDKFFKSLDLEEDVIRLLSFCTGQDRGQLGDT